MNFMYEDVLSQAFKDYLKNEPKTFGQHPFESSLAVIFLDSIYQEVKSDLFAVLKQREKDRTFIDERTRALNIFNKKMENDFLSAEYKTVLGLKDGDDRLVVGAHFDQYHEADLTKKVAPLPDFLKGPHVTLFGPPENAKMCINAMNAYHRQIPGEPSIVKELLSKSTISPMWGADSEDSKTPLHQDLLNSNENLKSCFDGKISFSEKDKIYQLEKSKLALPIKRFVGLALPCYFYQIDNQFFPLHIYDFALHLFHNWQKAEALVFYVPKLENEEEARYLKKLIDVAEKNIHKLHPVYKLGSVRLMIVLENPRAVFRVNEIIDALYPYFAGASLGWHDYLASTARLFKEDSFYRIPVKADPNIVIKYIKASHEILSKIVGPKGGIKVGGMYGILPIKNEIESNSFQLCLAGFFKDIIIQLKRDLDGFWVAHPDFVRIGIALVEAFKFYKIGKEDYLLNLINAYLKQPYSAEVISFLKAEDKASLDTSDALYARSLIVADLKQSDHIANNDPEEIRYNVFQTLQYLADWLSGNGCVALPALIQNTAIRVMDDLATAERSRWEVWHEIYHKRFDLYEFLKIAHEEMLFIRKDLSDEKKIVQVKWTQENAKWYEVAFNLMIKLMTDSKPVEFASYLLIPFTIPTIRQCAHPWQKVLEIDPLKFQLNSTILRFNYFFERCGNLTFSKTQAASVFIDIHSIENSIQSFSFQDILDAAKFHGDIGIKKNLDTMAQNEQSQIKEGKEINELLVLAEQYKEKFKMKFLISAQNKKAGNLLEKLKERIKGSLDQEIENAKKALFEITQKRIEGESLPSCLAFKKELEVIAKKYSVKNAQLSYSINENIVDLSFGSECTENSLFQIASLSKTLATVFSLEVFNENSIDIDDSVNKVLENVGSIFRLKNKSNELKDEVNIRSLMNHTALNMHYVKGFERSEAMPTMADLLIDNESFGYEKVYVRDYTQAESFSYSGGGFLVLEHIIECILKDKKEKAYINFCQRMGFKHLNFSQEYLEKEHYAQALDEKGVEINGGSKKFPLFAAGMMSNAHDLLIFLKHLENAFHQISYKNISHDIAVTMLENKDLGAQEFMGANIGLGVFVAHAGLNKMMVHQGANDGYRALYLHCYSGPDKGAAISVLASGELNAVKFISEVSRKFLSLAQFSGIDFKKWEDIIDLADVPSEQMVNKGYKNLIFQAFNPLLPEAIANRSALNLLCDDNLCIDAKILSVTNQKFARAENLFSPYEPVFDPELFEPQGKVMDSWESARHSEAGEESLIFEIKNKSIIKYISFCTKFHLGNQVEDVSVFGLNSKSEWISLASHIKLLGHAYKVVEVKTVESYSIFKVTTYPDGGLTRLGLFDKKCPFPIQGVYLSDVPKSKKPLTLAFDKTEIKKTVKKDNHKDLASLAEGGSIEKVSNEHFGPASAVISPYPPMHMFDGFESARSREKGHFEELVIKLAKVSTLSRIVFDFKFFVNNNPSYLKIFGYRDGEYHQLTNKFRVKAFAGNSKEIVIKDKNLYSKIKIEVYPDGGINRIHIFN